MGKAGQRVPEMTDEYCQSVSQRYIELYEGIVGKTFERDEHDDLSERIRKNVEKYLATLK
jgi:phosphoribosylaminoimidazole-succinocarboxamide synthase